MSVKLSVSMSSALYQQLERVRQGRGIARSLAVQEALKGWVAGGGNSLDADYLAAYQREPESPAEMDAWAAASAEVWSSELASGPKKTTQRGRKRAQR